MNGKKAKMPLLMKAALVVATSPIWLVTPYVLYQSNKHYEERLANLGKVERTGIIRNAVIIENSPPGHTKIYRGNGDDRSRDLWDSWSVENSNLEIISDLEDDKKPYAEIKVDGLKRVKKATLHIIGDDIPRYESLGNGGAQVGRYYWPCSQREGC